MKNNLKRIIAFLLAFIILPCTFIISAVDYTSSDYSDVQLLNSGFHFVSGADSLARNLWGWFNHSPNDIDCSNLFFIKTHYNSDLFYICDFSKMSHIQSDNFDYYYNACDSVYYAFSSVGISSLTETYVNNISSDYYSTPLIPGYNQRLFCIRIDKSLNYTDLDYLRVAPFSYISGISETTVSGLNYSSYRTSWFRLPDTSTDIPDSVPKQKLDLWGVNIRNIDKVGFKDWFFNNNKTSYVTDCVTGLASSTVDDVIDWWADYGSSLVSAILHIPQLLTKINVVSIDAKAVSRVKTCLDNLYSEYQMYLHTLEAEKLKNDSSHMHWRTDQEGNSDYSLTEDQTSDTSLISILREILRYVISLPDRIAKALSYIPVYFDAFLRDLDIIINSINNLSFDVPNSTNDNIIDVDISVDKQHDVDLFFDDWSTKLTSKFNEKFPMSSQLSSLFTNFFEKCGIDTSSDTQNNYYYSSVPSNSLMSAVGSDDSSQSGLSASEALLSDLSTAFPDSDSSYFTDFYSPDIPAITINVAGESKEIVNFRLYAKYRNYIFTLISFILWVVYLLSLYKSLPTMIGRVADMRDVLVSNEGVKDDVKE